MYAYKQQYQQQPLHAVPQTHVTRPLRNRRTVQRTKPVKKKQNLFARFLAMCFVSTLALAYALFVFPTTFNSLVKQVAMPNNIPLRTNYNSTKPSARADYISAVNLYTTVNPITNYIHNGFFNNTYLLAPAIHKQQSNITMMYQTNELIPLKKSLMTLATQYPTIKPSIYVWEYDNGEFVNINADKLYASASIIKIPVLVRLFKSIEQKQFNMNDEMTMLEQYRSTGSGDLQYSQANKNYTMDYLAKIMIQDSDNTATNMIISKLGGMDDINSGLREWGISTTYVKTWLPDMDGTNKTTALDIAKILYNLDNPAFLNINSREAIIDCMSRVKNNRLIQAGLGEGALFVHKTGDIGTMLGDAGIVYAPNGKKYIIVVLAERPYNSPQGKDFIVNASSIIYKFLVK